MYRGWLYLVDIIEDSELQHHGILGMKWGVRRFQNYDGSYTKKGLERYNKVKSLYDEADKRVKSLKNEPKDSIKEAKMERKKAKRDLSKAYDSLKNDYRADKGKDLYRHGKTINDINSKTSMLNLAAVVGTPILATGVKKIYSANGKTEYKIAAAAAVGTIAAGIGFVNAQANMQKKDLRAYYGH